MATKKATAAKGVAKKTVSTKTAAPAETIPAAKAPVVKMTKTQVIRQLSEQLEVAPKQVADFIDALIGMATTQTKEQGEFTIPGLGKLVKAQRAARTGRNPATGEPIEIKASTTVKFRLAKSAKDAVVPSKS